MNPPLVRPALQADIPGLRLVELAAATRFAETDLPPHFREQTLDPTELLDSLNQRLLWVAEDQDELLGFLAAREENANIHILEMSVVPSRGRQGIGSSLLDAAVREAKRRDLSGITLTTFSHVAWNGPAYSKAGFRQLDEAGLTPALRRRLACEREQGLCNRIAMHRNAA